MVRAGVLDAALFYDAGKAVSRRGDLDFSGLKSDVGAGVRLHGPSQTVLRIEAARGREGSAASSASLRWE